MTLHIKYDNYFFLYILNCMVAKGDKRDANGEVKETYIHISKQGSR